MVITLKGEWETKKVWINGERLDSGPSLKIWNHSPDGFAWGYGGSGPAQLALAVLLKFTDSPTAVANYQSFKWEIISQLDQDDFEVEININSWLARKEMIQ